MTLDNQTQKIIDKVNSLGLPPAHMRSVDDLRAGSAEYGYGYISTAEIKEIRNITIPVSSGKIGIRLYIPKGEGPFPVYINLHGGGWVLGSIDSSQDSCQELCNRARCITIAVDYNLAPESKFPIPFNDCYEATEWVHQNITQYGGDPDNIVIGGISAGGNLAAAVALKARDMKSVVLKGQLLVVPVTDHNFETESYQKYAEGYILTASWMRWYWNHYLVDLEDGKHQYASPLRASSHADLPPALLIISEFDPLRDDGRAYVQALKDSGVRVEEKIYPSIHGLVSMADRIDMGKEALEVMASFLRERFES